MCATIAAAPLAQMSQKHRGRRSFLFQAQATRPSPRLSAALFAHAVRAHCQIPHHPIPLYSYYSKYKTPPYIQQKRCTYYIFTDYILQAAASRKIAPTLSAGLAVTISKRHQVKIVGSVGIFDIAHTF